MTAHAASDNRQLQPLHLIQASTGDLVLVETGDAYDGFVRTFRTWLGTRPLDISELRTRVQELVAAGHHQAAHNEYYAIRSRVLAAFERTPDALDLGKRHLVEVELEEIRRLVPKPERAAVSTSKVLSRADLVRLLAGMSYRTALVTAFLNATGCRVSEALGIRVSQCKEVGDRVECSVLGKGGKVRTLKPSAALYAEICGEFAGETWLFETSAGKPMTRGYVGKQIRAAGKRVLGRLIGPHCLRHTFATQRLQDGSELTAVSKALGHSSVSITASTYVHTGLSDAELDAQEILPKRAVA